MVQRMYRNGWNYNRSGNWLLNSCSDAIYAWEWAGTQRQTKGGNMGTDLSGGVYVAFDNLARSYHLHRKCLCIQKPAKSIMTRWWLGKALMSKKFYFKVSWNAHITRNCAVQCKLGDGVMLTGQEPFQNGPYIYLTDWQPTSGNFALWQYDNVRLTFTLPKRIQLIMGFFYLWRGILPTNKMIESVRSYDLLARSPEVERHPFKVVIHYCQKISRRIISMFGKGRNITRNWCLAESPAANGGASVLAQGLFYLVSQTK